ncbi:MAG: glycosyltransferase family 39 protein [Chloroflexi bacterium]|nr:glycosyltransferase family 39 protein [Chloroflexota bacterium]
MNKTEGGTGFFSLFDSSNRLPALVIFGLAFMLRLAWAIKVKAPPISDFQIYDLVGLSVSKGAGFTLGGQPMSAWGPGYPAFLGTLYFLVGHSIGAAKLANALFGGVSALLLFFIGQRVFGLWAGALSGLMLAVYPEHLYYSALLASENLFIPLLLGSILLYLIGREQSDWRIIGAAGLLLGAGTLVRPAGVVVPAAFAFWELVTWEGFRKVAIRLAVFGVAMIILIAPWTIRNYYTFNGFVPLSTSSGVSLWMGFNQHATGGYYFPSSPQENPFYGMTDVVKEDERGRQLGLHFIQEHPGKALKLYWVKMRILYGTGSDAVMWLENSLGGSLLDNRGPLAGAIETGAYWFVWISALAGLAFTRLRRGPAWLFIFLFAVWSLFHPIIITARRFRLPIMPAMILFSGYAVYKVVGFLGTRLPRKPAEA